MLHLFSRKNQRERYFNVQVHSPRDDDSWNVTVFKNIVLEFGEVKKKMEHLKQFPGTGSNS